jgi:hypothetical protein
MVGEICGICFGVGRVSRTHPDRAWHSELGCMCDRGDPCPCRLPALQFKADKIRTRPYNVIWLHRPKKDT